NVLASAPTTRSRLTYLAPLCVCGTSPRPACSPGRLLPSDRRSKYRLFSEYFPTTTWRRPSPPTTQDAAYNPTPTSSPSGAYPTDAQYTRIPAIRRPPTASAPQQQSQPTQAEEANPPPTTPPAAPSAA